LPTRVNREVEVRPLRTDDDWAQATESQVAVRDERHQLEPYRVFQARKMARYRTMAEAAVGAWFGAFLEGRLVADLGLYTDGTFGRFQSVGTHPDYRRRGICGTLVHAAAEHALQRFGVKTLVMVADPEYHAARIYMSLGFAPTEQQLGLEWADRDGS
jgi:predicted GNAT family acetyltransferase